MARGGGHWKYMESKPLRVDRSKIKGAVLVEPHENMRQEDRDNFIKAKKFLDENNIPYVVTPGDSFRSYIDDAVANAKLMELANKIHEGKDGMPQSNVFYQFPSANRSMSNVTASTSAGTNLSNETISPSVAGQGLNTTSLAVPNTDHSSGGNLSANNIDGVRDLGRPDVDSIQNLGTSSSPSNVDGQSVAQNQGPVKDNYRARIIFGDGGRSFIDLIKKSDPTSCGICTMTAPRDENLSNLRVWWAVPLPQP
jgi:hypothetical protein